MGKPTVYVETSVISYLTARPSRRPAVAERQRVTRSWWDRRTEFRFVTSQLVIDEIGRGDPAWARARRQVAEDLERIEFDPVPSEDLADRLVLGGSLPIAARDDALHVAVATLAGADYLTTWNLKHLANRTIRQRIEKLIRAASLEPVTITTPGELLEIMP